MAKKHATPQQWQEIYTLTQTIRKMKPWLEFEDMDIFGLKAKGLSKIIYASIMGFYGKCCAIAFYEGEQGLTDLCTVASLNPSNLYWLRYQAMEISYSIISLDEEHTNRITDPEQTAIYDQLNLDLQSAPLVHVKKAKQPLSTPNYTELNKIILGLKTLIEAIENYQQTKVCLDFTQHIFIYHSDTQQHRFKPFTFKPKEYPFIELLPEEIEPIQDTLEQVPETWIIDINYLDVQLDVETNEPYQAQMLLMLDQESNSVISAELLQPDYDEISQVLNFLLQNLENMTIKPQTIIVRNPMLYNTYLSACFSLDIELHQEESIDICDDFYSWILTQYPENLPS